MILLQKFGFKESKYERPQDKWVCGHMADGKPCYLGPGKDGSCRVSTACNPFKDQNGRWHCRRSPQDGGPCQPGPYPGGACAIKLAPCVPMPSLRTTRKRVAIWASVLAIGLCALILSGGAANKWLMPGQLSAQHESVSSCSGCHAGTSPGKMAWVHRVVTAATPKDNSQLCMTCHDVGAHPFSPHTHPVEALKQITKTISERPADPTTRKIGWTQRIAFAKPDLSSSSGQPEIFCATCHKEHQGEFHDLAKVSNERCQSCHVNKFGNFADSHPKFTNYPYSRRTRIIFDHQSHMGKHFEAAAKTSPAPFVPNACTDCHQPGLDRRTMQVKSYPAMCAGCHQGDIQGESRAAGSKGIDFLAVPGLDIETLSKKGINIGEWPKFSEAKVTPFMQLLFASAGELSSVELAAAGTDLLDLGSASDEELEKVKALAWSVKKLFNRLENEKLEAVIGGGSGAATADRTRTAALTGAISYDVIVGANREWFPKLQEELAAFEKNEPPTTAEAPEKDKPAVDPEDWASYGGWYRQDFTVRYRPSGHADPFLKTWLDYTSRGAGTPQGVLLTPVLQQLTPQDAVGRCTKCHSIDDDNDAKTINWAPLEGKRTRNRFTTFAHKPHIAAVGDKGCVTCHKLTPGDSEFLKTFAEGNPNSYTANFQFIDKATCATCHSKQTHWQSCTLCHAYHVGEFAEPEALLRRAPPGPQSMNAPPYEQAKGQ